MILYFLLPLVTATSSGRAAELALVVLSGLSFAYWAALVAAGIAK